MGAWAAIPLSDSTWASSVLSDFSDSLLSSIISGVGSSIIVNGLGSSTLVRLVTGFLSVVTNIYLNLNTCLAHSNLQQSGNIIGSNTLSSFGGVIMYLRDRSVHWSYTQHVLHSCTVYRLYTCKAWLEKIIFLLRPRLLSKSLLQDKIIAN